MHTDWVGWRSGRRSLAPGLVPTDKLTITQGSGRNCAFEKSVEQKAPVAGCPPVEAKRELVEVRLEMFRNPG